MTHNVSKSWWSSDSDSDCQVVEDPHTAMVVPEVKLVKQPKIAAKPTTQTKTHGRQWVCPSFDDFNFGASTVAKSTQHVKQKPTVKTASYEQTATKQKDIRDSFKSKNVKSVKRKRIEVIEEDLWADKYTPTSQVELAVHKKKITEIESWLQDHCRPNRKSPVLLLTGPSGCGKTACLKVLTNQLDIEVHEWVNPVVNEWSEDFSASSEYRPIGGYTSESQSAKFEDFVLRANRYQTLQIFANHTSKTKIILVEEFPNVFFRNVAGFHNILRKYSLTGRCPLVFIVSDSTGGESNERLLFPKHLQDELNISNISFNPVAPTSMVKVLSKIATQESKQGSPSFFMPDKSTLESLSSSCSGDIRGAINTLQFICLQNPGAPVEKITVQKKNSTKGKSLKSKDKTNKSYKKSAAASLPAIGGKDSTLFLFRALGKILYCKRSDPSESASVPTLPPHLLDAYRDPLTIDPEDVVEKTHLSPEYFTAYLHQNYPEFFTSIDDIVSASSYLSDADYLTTDWVSRNDMKVYASSVATRGLIFSNSSRATHSSSTSGGLGWKPLHKPQWFTTMKKAREKCIAARDLFRGLGQAPIELQTEVLPFLARTNTTLHSPRQITFLQDLCKFPSSKFTPRIAEKLGEHDVEETSDVEDFSQVPTNNTRVNQEAVAPVDNDDIISNSQSAVNSSHVEDEAEDEDLLIEDFDDDF